MSSCIGYTLIFLVAIADVAHGSVKLSHRSLISVPPVSADNGSPPKASCAALGAQCGGTGWEMPCCDLKSTCKPAIVNGTADDTYSHCKPTSSASASPSPPPSKASAQPSSPLTRPPSQNTFSPTPPEAFPRPPLHLPFSEENATHVPPTPKSPMYSAAPKPSPSPETHPITASPYPASHPPPSEKSTTHAPATPKSPPYPAAPEPSPSPETKPITATPTSPYSAPPGKESKATCNGKWKQCGGWHNRTAWKSTQCCPKDFVCVKLNEFFSQCQPWRFAWLASCNAKWAQCGGLRNGRAWDGPTCCTKGFSCQKSSASYWQCKHKPATMSSNSTSYHTSPPNKTGSYEEHSPSAPVAPEPVPGPRTKPPSMASPTPSPTPTLENGSSTPPPARSPTASPHTGPPSMPVKQPVAMSEPPPPNGADTLTSPSPAPMREPPASSSNTSTGLSPSPPASKA